jgi:hypothetical protein
MPSGAVALLGPEPGRRGQTRQENQVAFDALSELRAGGNQVDLLSDSQRAALSELSPEEVAMLNSVKARVDAVSGEVVGQEVDVAGGNVF